MARLGVGNLSELFTFHATFFFGESGSFHSITSTLCDVFRTPAVAGCPAGNAVISCVEELLGAVDDHGLQLHSACEVIRGWRSTDSASSLAKKLSDIALSEQTLTELVETVTTGCCDPVYCILLS